MITLEQKYLPYLHGCWPGLKKALESASPEIILDKGDEALRQSAINHAAYEKVLYYLEQMVNDIPQPTTQPFIDPNYEPTLTQKE